MKVQIETLTLLSRGPMAQAEAIAPTESGGICVSSLLSGFHSRDDDLFRSRPGVNFCDFSEVKELRSKIDIQCIVNPRNLEEPMIGLPGVRSVLLVPEMAPSSSKLPSIPELSSLAAKNLCGHSQDRISSPSPSSSSCVTEVQWSRSSIDSTNTSSRSSNSNSCDDKVPIVSYWVLNSDKSPFLLITGRRRRRRRRS